MIVKDAVVAWRTWNIATVLGRVSLLPVGDHRVPWTPRRPIRARCARHRLHRAPVFGCTCGLHALKHESLLQRTRGPAVVGRVALWGQVIEHEDGYRAQFGYPQRIRLVCPICFWQRGLDAGPPAVVALPSRGDAHPLCADHLRIARECGFRFRRIVPSVEVEASVLGRYAVDLLAE